MAIVFLFEGLRGKSFLSPGVLQSISNRNSIKVELGLARSIPGRDMAIVFLFLGLQGKPSLSRMFRRHDEWRGDYLQSISNRNSVNGELETTGPLMGGTGLSSRPSYPSHSALRRIYQLEEALC
jgi:hypothetical protein